MHGEPPPKRRCCLGRRRQSESNSTLGVEDDLFLATLDLARKRGCKSDGFKSAKVVEVTGADAPWLNQKFHVVETSIVEEVLRRDTWQRIAGMRILGKGKAGKWMYLARQPSEMINEGKYSLPYFWRDSRNRQWKLATLGLTTSHCLSGLTENGIFPNELGEWKAPPHSRRNDNWVRDPTRMRIAVLPEPSIFDSSVPVDGERDHALAESSANALVYPELQPIALSHADASDFYNKGFLIKRAADLGTWNSAGRALRATNLIVRDLGGKQAVLREYTMNAEDAGFAECTAWLRECPVLWTLLTRLLGSEIERPRCLQVAVVFPDGHLGDSVLDRADEDPGVSWHIDGHGSPPCFALLVGCALSDAPSNAQSWGGFTVFPESHRNTSLHEEYMARAITGGSRRNLGDGLQLKMQRGDVIIAHPLLPHRRAKNWSEIPRHMVFLRLKPAGARKDWQKDVLKDPFATLKGVTETLAAVAVGTPQE